MISMKDIVLKRGNVRILDNVNLQIGQDEHWAILGRNGSGKTTLLEMMTGYLFPTSGQVEVLGNVYGQCDVREIRKDIGYISQSLLEKMSLKDPVWEAVATGAYAFLRFYQDIPDEAKEKAIQLLQEMKLGRTLEQPLGTLSQGERKKVMLARALMAEPKLLIMDEPCSGLDLYERENLLIEIDQLRQRNMSVIYVTHHIEEIVPLFTHVALIKDGKIAAAGPKKEVLTKETIMHTYDINVDLNWDEDRPWIRVRTGG